MMSNEAAKNSATISVGQYLAARLVQCGGSHAFGVPGDFTLSLLDELLSVHEYSGPGLTWIGSCNELNAA